MKYCWSRREDRRRAYRVVRRFLEQVCREIGFDKEKLIYLGRRKFSSLKPEVIYNVVEDLEERYKKKTY